MQSANIHNLRESPEFWKDNERKRCKDGLLIDNILDADNLWKTEKVHNDELRTLKNKLAKCFKNAPNNILTVLTDNIVDELLNNRIDVNVLAKEQLQEVRKLLNQLIVESDKTVKELLVRRDDMIKEVGNLLYEQVKVSNDEADNVIIKEKINYHNNMENKLGHVELMEK